MAGAVANASEPGAVTTVTRYVGVWPAWSVAAAGPGWKPVTGPGTRCGPGSSATAGGSPARVKFGASFTALTTSVNVRVRLLTFGAAPGPLSVSVTWTVAVPFVFGATVNVRVPSGATAGAAVN